MTNFEKILKEKNKTAYDIGKAMGKFAGTNNLVDLKNGKIFPGECDYYTIDFIARYLGVPQSAIMEQADLDGTTTFIKALSTLVRRLSKKFHQYDEHISFLYFQVKKQPFLGILIEEDDTTELIFIDLTNNLSWRAVYTVSTGFRECEFFKKTIYRDTPINSEPSLKMDTPKKPEPSKNLNDTPPTVNPVLNSDSKDEEYYGNDNFEVKIIDSVREDTEPGENIEYFQFMDELASVLYALR